MLFGGVVGGASDSVGARLTAFGTLWGVLLEVLVWSMLA